jgi:acetate kinase
MGSRCGQIDPVALLYLMNQRRTTMAVIAKHC